LSFSLAARESAVAIRFLPEVLVEERFDQEGEIAALLAARIGGGDAAAEAELVERYGRGVVFLLRRLGVPAEDVEDLRQETLRIVLERLRGPGLDDAAALAGFVHGTARFLAMNERRKFLRRRTETDTEALGEPPDPRADPLAEAIFADEARRVRQVIDKLPNDRDRQLLLRYYVADEEKERICADLGLEQTHFRRVLFRARERFRELAGGAWGTALLLAACGLLLYLVQAGRHRNEAEIAALRQQLESEKGRTALAEDAQEALERRLAEEAAAAAKPAPPSIEANLLPVFLGALRGDDQPAVEIRPPAGTEKVLLIFELAGEELPVYRARLLHQEKELWSGENLRPNDLGLTVAVPRHLLQSGTYRLEVEGLANGRKIPVGSSAFRVR
jgi:RNA polymerase sigma-70 factor (ECF subfamily)